MASVQVDPSDNSILEVVYLRGVPEGTYRHKRGDGQLISYGRCRGVERRGPCLRVRREGEGMGYHLVYLLQGFSFHWPGQL